MRLLRGSRRVLSTPRFLYRTDHPTQALWRSSPLCSSWSSKFEEAIPRFEAIAIQQRVYGEQHRCTVMSAQDLIAARQLAKQSAETRSMWPRASHVQPVWRHAGEHERMPVLPCMVLWRRLPAAALGRVQAAVQCVPAKTMCCSRCNKAKYCNSERQKAH